jgi:hypothetical protein
MTARATAFEGRNAAVDTCQAKINNPDGTSLVSAKNITGTPLSGDAAGLELTPSTTPRPASTPPQRNPRTGATLAFPREHTFESEGVIR